MVLSISWPGSIFFYPIGNTSAVDLTDTLTPEEEANVLLLGCGDPRNILFTVYSQRHDSSRTLDFTCCDVEPAILARNILLLTMIADNRLSADIIDKMWNIFFHFFLDEESTAFLEAQCQKLLRESTSLDAWNQSKYSSFLRFCNDHTRTELRRHWQLYIDALKSSSGQKQEIKEAVVSGMQKTRGRHGGPQPAGCRSAGPYILQSMKAASEVSTRFWKTGTTFVDEGALSSANNVNPTFVYSLVGTNFSVHFGISPIAPFHLAPAFLRSDPDSTTAPDLVNRAKSQFGDWVTSFRKFLRRQPGRIVIRLFCGEALHFCQALAEYRDTGSVAKDQTVAPWNASPLLFDGPDYAPGKTTAPLSFNVIETSNLTDHIGLFNVLIAATPLLSETYSATLFTETLLYVGKDPTKNFNRRLCADLPTISILFGLIPTSYPSNFSSRSNATEIILHKTLTTRIAQYHERPAWRRPTTSDALVSALNPPTLRQVAFEPLSLAKFLLGIYFRMFSSDDGLSVLTGSKHIKELLITYYTRETFVALVATIKRVVIVDWKTTLDMFFALLENTKSSFMLMGLHYHQELCAKIHLAGIYTVYAMKKEVAKQGRFLGWLQVPPTVSVTFVVPRESIRVLLDMDQDELSTSIIQASLQGQSAHSSFSSIKVGFGRVKSCGTDSSPRITFDADPAGWAGSSPLVVSFSLPSWTLHVEAPENMMIALSFRSSPQTVRLVPKLGMSLHIYKARLMDTSTVFVVPEEPHGVCYRLCNMLTPTGGLDGCKISAAMDSEGERVSMLTARADILDGPTKTILASGAPVTSHQVSPCTVQISVGPKKKRLVYPSPVAMTLSKLRIARKSCYIEVVAPPAGNKGFDINPFPVVVTEKVEAPWNIHRLNFDVLPTVDISEPEPLRQISVQFVCAATDREQSLRDAKDRTDTLLNVKNTIHVMLSEFPGSRRARVFALHTNKNIDTVIFVTSLRLDLASHGFVIDAQVLTLSECMVDNVRDTLGAIHREVRLIEFHGDEAVAWKRLLPAFAERCRTWKHGRNCEYLARNKVPLSLEYDGDPLCSCGKGQDVVPEFRKEKAWKSAIPYITRIAISPFYGVPYVENVGRLVAGLAARPLEPEKQS